MAKNFGLFIGLILLNLSLAYGQKEKITVQNDTMYRNRKPYALIFVQKRQYIENRIFSVRTIANNEVILVSPIKHSSFYEMIFRESGKIAYIQGGAWTFFRKKIARLIIENHLIDEKGVNAEQERRFIQIYGDRMVVR